MTTGEKIKRIRIRKSLTQSERGKHCGMADSQNGVYERGESKPMAAIIAQITEAINVDPKVLEVDL